jgi:uncharacterized protein YjiS (DUF1127 family)
LDRNDSYECTNRQGPIQLLAGQYVVHRPSVKPRPSGLGHWFAAIATAFSAWRQRQAVLQEMQLMTDRELSDIGLSRADLGRVFEPAFATDHARGRDYIAY